MTAAAAPLRLTDFRRDSLPRIADGLAAAVVASLPWSTSATGILIVLWLIAVLPMLELPALRMAVRSAPGGLPVLLLLFAIMGLCWGHAPWPERWRGIEPFLRLLMIPVLFAQFRRSDRGVWVGAGFLVSGAVLLGTSFSIVLLGFDLGHGPGVPVKDYITQSGIFALCGFALLDIAVDQWAERRRVQAAICVAAALLFMSNIVYVTTGRTTLAVIPVLFLLWGMYRLSRPQLAIFLIAGGVLGAVLWTTSPYMRERVTGISTEITEFQETGKETSAGSRLEFWKNSLRVLGEAPVLGHGTGTISETFRRDAEASGGSSATNPHNQIFAIGIQLGAVGVVLLLAMWGVHWRLFFRLGLAAWIGLMAVTQNIVSSLFNSHLMDFTQAWIYVFAVGVCGGIIFRRQDAAAAAAASRSAPSPSR